MTDLTKAYTLAVHTWENTFTVMMLFTEVISWNNTLSDQDGQSIFDKFKESVEYMQEETLQKIKESATYDLGSYTQEYNDILFKVNKR